jgi:hypothetical protein
MMDFEITEVEVNILPQGRVPGFSCGNSGKPWENLPQSLIAIKNLREIIELCSI